MAYSEQFSASLACYLFSVAFGFDDRLPKLGILVTNDFNEIQCLKEN